MTLDEYLTLPEVTEPLPIDGDAATLDAIADASSEDESPFDGHLTGIASEYEAILRGMTDTRTDEDAAEQVKRLLRVAQEAAK